MSELFLDTQLDAADHARIAMTLASSGYSVDELDQILWSEVCPVLWGNCLCVAGAWSGFDMNEVERRILSRPAGAVRRWLSYTAAARSLDMIGSVCGTRYKHAELFDYPRPL